MKLIIIACLVVVALARPDEDATIIRDDRVGPVIPDHSYNYNVETSNGILKAEEGTPGAEGQINKRGSYRYTDDEGNVIEVSYVADENGFKAEGAHIP